MEGKNEGGLGMRLVYESINSCKQLYIVTVFHMLLILSGCCYIYYIEKAYITHDVNSHTSIALVYLVWKSNLVIVFNFRLMTNF